MFNPDPDNTLRPEKISTLNLPLTLTLVPETEPDPELAELAQR